MSNKHIENLTVRLLQALDKNYDVVNMDAVLSVIAALENTNITKEQLEATRLAKYINLFRRRTTSEQLAKRAKSLLKRWREMVGMQQRPCNDLIRNEGATSSNCQENINLIDGQPAVQQNLNNNKNAYSSSSYSGKIENYESSGKVPITTAPTSFSNVLAGFSGGPTERNNLPSFANTNVSNGPSARRKNIGNLKRSAEPFSETFSYERPSHLNSQLGNCLPIDVPNKLSLITEPIIIDIEDSNSDSNLVEQPPGIFEKDDDDDDVVVINNIGEKSNKHKKSKKDKKRAARERSSIFQEFSTPLVVIDPESSLSQQPNLCKQSIPNTTLAEKEIPSNTDEKISNENMMVTNISEILSLSNSSMSSVFPTSSVAATKNLFSQQRPLTESELSFAGKFANQQSVSTSTIATTPIIISNENKSNMNFNIDDADESVKATTTTTGVTDSSSIFQPFVGTTVCNSNDSASGSYSAFAIIDCSSPGRNKSQVKQTEPDRPKVAGCKDVASKRQLLCPIAEATQSQTNLKLSSASANPTPMIPQQQQQQQKVPKKRGRKKGSKGIDSLIAKDTSLSSQMLMQSLGSGAKKVKTTKELYAEMQNRKMGVSTPTTPSHWGSGGGGGGGVGGQSHTFVRRDSFCSEPSLHSFDACSTNATVSTIATSSTPEKVSLQRPTADNDSGSESVVSGGQSRESVAMVSSSDKVESSQNKPSLKEISKKRNTAKMLTTVEIQLRELVEKLPTISSKETIERECESGTVPCSCKIYEIIPKQPEQELENAANNGANLLSLNALNESNNVLKGDSSEPFITISIDKVDDSSSQPLTGNVTSTVKESSLVKNQPERPKKSIFDVDFEDEEDPLHTLIAEVAASASGTPEGKTEIHDNETVEESSAAKPFSEDEALIQNPKLEMQENDDVIPNDQKLSADAEALMPSFEIEEDEACLAKQRFELQVQNITNYHIRSLHNFFIPNVNGNWDETYVPKENFNSKGLHLSRVTEDLLPDGSNVVPKYTSAECGEYIRKDLRDVEFCEEFKPKARPNSVEKLFYETPFLGVSRCLKSLKSSHRKTRKHRQTTASAPEQDQLLQLSDNRGTGGVQSGNESREKEEVEHFITVGNMSPGRSIQNSINSPLKLVFDDMETTIETTIALSKSSASSESKTLLAIAPNVNFNNNQIGNSVLGETMTTTTTTTESNSNAKKLCEDNLDGETVKMDLCTQDHRNTFGSDDDGGDLKNNNCNDKFEKLEESSCESHSSLKKTQKSINLKIRQLQEQNNTSKSSSYSKRKRRRKKTSSRGKRPKIKRIRIAINGGITTQRHIQMGTTTSEDGSESDSYIISRKTADVQEVLHHRGDCSESEKDVEYTSSYGAKNWEQEESKDDDADISEEEEEFFDSEEDCEYEDEDEIEEEDEYSGDFHEVVTRDISRSSESGNNHIVLTIKKTPSKLNSPCSSLPPVSPVIGNQTLPITVCSAEINKEEDELKEILTTGGVDVDVDENDVETQNDAESEATTNIAAKDNFVKKSESLMCANLLRKKYTLNRPMFRQRRYSIKRKNKECKPFRFPDETNSSGTGCVFKKKHQQLFFTHEIFVETTSGYKRPLFDISTCSSSCAESSEYEYESLSGKEDNNSRNKVVKVEKPARNTTNKNVLLDSEHSAACFNQSETETQNGTTSEVEAFDDNDDDDKNDNPDDDYDEQNHKLHLSSVSMGNNKTLPEENNGLLESFNNIFVPSSALDDNDDVDDDDDDGSANGKTNNCDEFYSKDFSKNGNCNNQEMMYDEKKYATSTPHLECISGLRQQQSVEHNADNVNQCGGFQEFKEWNQLLQLQSYNNELLTVLPYVVLD